MSEITRVRRTAALLALALGAFGIGAAEFASMGLLSGIAGDLLGPEMATDSEAGIAHAGTIISAYAFGVVVGAPLFALISVRMPRRGALVALLALLALGTTASAVLPGFGLLLLARFAAGLPHGAYIGFASLLAGQIMGRGNEAKGVAAVLSGLTVANLAGVPVLTALGQAAGWRMAYLAIAGIFLLACVLVRVTVPRQEVRETSTVRQELSAFTRPQLWIVIAMVAVGFGSSFAVFAYISEIATEHAGMSAATVPLLLAGAGLGMTVGNALGGSLADKSLRSVILLGFPAMVAALALLETLGGTGPGLFIGFFLLNLANSSMTPAAQIRLIQVAGPAKLMGASLNHAAFNLANALGAALGGAAIAAGLGYESPAIVGIILALGGFLLALATLGLETRDEARDLQSAIEQTTLRRSAPTEALDLSRLTETGSLLEVQVPRAV